MKSLTIGLLMELLHNLSMRILIISWSWVLFFRIIFSISFELKLMEKIIFSVRLNNTEGSPLELFIRKYWSTKNILDDPALSLHLVICLFWWSSGGMQVIFLLLRNDFKIDQHVLVLVKAFTFFFQETWITLFFVSFD